MSIPATEPTPDIPVPCRVVARTDEAPGVVTLRVRPLFGELKEFRPAQFSMIGVCGVGEVPISVSSRVDDRIAHAFTIRRSGAVTHALVERAIGDVVTVRGPFGRPWNLDRVRGRHAVFVAGGIGLAPLRAAVEEAIDGPAARVSVLVGAATPDHQIYRSWLQSLATDRVDIHRAVDVSPGADSWSGHVGFVTDLIPAVVGGADVAAFVCGPDAMMVATVSALQNAGVHLDDIEVTLERNMQCGTGWCGHCQLGRYLLCRDGPVLRADELGDHLRRAEL